MVLILNQWERTSAPVHAHTHNWCVRVCVWSSCFSGHDLSSLCLSPQGGLYFLQLFDHYVCSGNNLLLLSVCQSIAIGWIYGEFGFTLPRRHDFKLVWRPLIMLHKLRKQYRAPQSFLLRLHVYFLHIFFRCRVSRVHSIVHSLCPSTDNKYSSFLGLVWYNHNLPLQAPLLATRSMFQKLVRNIWYSGFFRSLISGNHPQTSAFINLKSQQVSSQGASHKQTKNK